MGSKNGGRWELTPETGWRWETGPPKTGDTGFETSATPLINVIAFTKSKIKKIISGVACK